MKKLALLMALLMLFSIIIPVSAEETDVIDFKADEYVPFAWEYEASSAKSWGKVENLFDGTHAKIWHSDYKEADGKITEKSPLPHTVTVTFPEAMDIAGFRYYPRTWGGTSGKVKEFSVYGSADGEKFTLIGKGSFTYTPGMADITPKDYKLPKAGSYKAIKIEITVADSDYGTGGELRFLKPAGDINTDEPVEIINDSWTITTTSEKSWGKAERLFDDKMDTIWHTNYAEADGKVTGKDELPQSVTATFGDKIEIGGIRYYPRISGGYSGKVKKFKLYGSVDGTNFTLIGEGTFAYTPNMADTTPKNYMLAKSGEYKAIRFEAIEAEGGYATGAELKLLTPGVIGGAANAGAAGTTETPSAPATGTTTPAGSQTSGEKVLDIPEPTVDLAKTYSDINLDPSEITPKATWTATASSEKSWGKADDVITGRKDDCWHTNYDEADGKITHKDPPPYELVVNFNEEVEFSGMRFYVRKNNYSGYFNEADIYVSDDGETFYKISHKTYDNGRSGGATSPIEAPNTVKFGANIKARAVKVVVTDSWNSLAVLAELAFLKPDPFWSETVTAKEYYERLPEFTFSFIDREGMTAKASSEQPYHGMNTSNAYNLSLIAQHVLEDNNSIWHTQYMNEDGTTEGFNKKVFPAWLEIDLAGEKTFCGVALKPRGSHARSGHWKAFEISISDDGVNWEPYVAFDATMPEAVSFDDQYYFFYEYITTRYIRFDITSSLADSCRIANSHATLCEVNFLVQDSVVEEQKAESRQHFELTIGSKDILVKKGKVDAFTKTIDVAPQIVNGTTLIPLRGLFEEMGAEVIWHGDTQEIEVKKDDMTVKFRIEDNRVFADGLRYSAIVAPRIVDGRTLIPLRIVSEILGYTVGWDGATQKITIESN